MGIAGDDRNEREARIQLMIDEYQAQSKRRMVAQAYRVWRRAMHQPPRETRRRSKQTH